MKCPRCQHENRPQAKFCEECGTPLARSCPKCGSTLSPSGKFCPECGQPVGGASEAPPRLPAPDTYTPKHLAEKILTSKSALEGERKQVTVLFADLKGSMELLADRDPEEARKLLDPVLERMMEAVHHYEGTVNQVMGDGIMALFGAPLAHEDHAVRACYAALRMQQSVQKYADEVRRSHGAVVKIRVGLNSGEVVVRTIGSDLHMDYTAVGQTTHLAARMEQLADPGAIVIPPDTLTLVEGYVEVKSLGPVPVKGLADTMEVYEVTGASLARTRLQAAASRGLTRFVGRDAELEQLRHAQQLAGAGHGQVAAIVGEAGVGKSRLVYEFTHSHRLQGWLVLESASVSYGKATSYLPVIDLLKGYFKIQDRDDLREIREKVTGRLLSLDRALEPSLSALLWLLGVPIEDPQWQRLDPPQRRQRTLDAVKRLLLRESQVQPLLLLFEDLHWVDSETQALLDGLIESLPTARVLLLVNYRPEYQHAWSGKTYYRQLRIDPLPPESAEALLNAVLGADRTLEPLKRVFIERTEGNPFFLEESVRTLVETRVLVGERGAYRLAKAPDAWQIPATAQAILAARIDRLAPEDKRLLQAASVIGKDVPFALLQAISDLLEGSLRGGLTHLQAAEFLYETRLFPDLEYTFKHAFTQEVAYGSVLQERRRALHARAVDAIEALYPERLAEHVERLAYHAFRGELWEKAVHYLRQAGGKSMERSAYREAATAFEQALDALRHLPESRARTEQAIDLHLDASGVLVPTGAQVKSTDHALKAEALAEALGDERRLGSAVVWLADRAWYAGDSDRAVAMVRQALAIADRLDDVALKISANFSLGLIEQTMGNYRQAVERLSQSVEALQGDRLHDWYASTLRSVFARERLARCLVELGEFAEAMARAEEAVQIASRVDHHHSLVIAFRSQGIVCLRLGDVLRAIPPLERAVELCRVGDESGDRSRPPSRDTPAQQGVPWGRFLTRSFFDVSAAHLGCAYALSGRLVEGVALMEEALADPAATGTTNHPLLLAYLGEGYLLAGRRDDALAVARRAVDLAQHQKERGNEAWVLCLLGNIATHTDPPDRESAAQYYRRALDRANELGMRPLVAHCHLGLGKLYRRTSDRAKADGYLTTAAPMYRDMGMTFWLEKAEAAMGPPHGKSP